VSCKPFHLYDVEFDLWSVESIGLPSVVMRGDCGEVRCCGLMSHPVFRPKLNAFLYVYQDQVSHIKRQIVE
jgi:hypothetical protein